MSIIRYEFQKIIGHKIFLIFFIGLLVGNMFLICAHEKNESVYKYIYEQKEQYMSYLEAKEEKLEYAYYRWIDEQEEMYIASYPLFLNEMEERARRMETLNLYSDKDSFLYRNIEKTCADFQQLKKIVLEVGNSYGVRQLTDYNWGIIFSISFLIISAYYLFYYERNQGLLLLLKGTKNGHCILALSKWFVWFICIIIYELIQEISTIYLFGYLYGYGDLSRNIQSISEFRNCMYIMTVEELLIFLVLIRVVICLVLMCLMYAVGVGVRSEQKALLIVGLFLGVEILCSKNILSNSRFVFLKSVNIFHLWDLRNCFGNYLNINVFEYAIGKDVCAVLGANVLTIVGVIIGTWLFHIQCQLCSEKKYNQIRNWFKRKTSFLWKHTRISIFEIYKVFIQQKKGVFLVFTLFLCIYNIQGNMITENYYSAAEAVYHNCMDKIVGNVSDEGVKFVRSEQAYIEKLYRKIEELKFLSSTEQEILGTHYQEEIDMKEEGIQMVVTQIESLQNKSRDFYDKYFVDEKDYINLWYDEGDDLWSWLLGSVVIIIWTSGIYPSEYKSKMLVLLQTTKKGHKSLHRSKNIAALFGTVFIIITIQLPMLVEYYMIDKFSVMQQRLSDFTMLSLEGNLTIGTFLMIVFVLKIISQIVVMIVTIWVSRTTKSEMVTDIICIGIVLMIFILLFYLKKDICGLILDEISTIML